MTVDNKIYVILIFCTSAISLLTCSSAISIAYNSHYMTYNYLGSFNLKNTKNFTLDNNIFKKPKRNRLEQTSISKLDISDQISIHSHKSKSLQDHIEVTDSFISQDKISFKSSNSISIQDSIEKSMTKSLFDNLLIHDSLIR